MLSIFVKVAKVDLDWCTAKSTPTTRGSSNGAACGLFTTRLGAEERNIFELYKTESKMFNSDEQDSTPFIQHMVATSAAC